MKRHNFIGILAVNILSFVLTTTLLMGQDVRESLFAETDKTIALAKKVKADILAPKNYNEAMKYYSSAEQDFKKGKNLENIRKNLQKTVQSLKKAVTATKLAEVTFTGSLQARTDAQKAGAPTYSVENWKNAEKKFAEAAKKLEDGDVKEARKKETEARKMFRTAELTAIKNNLLNETRNLLVKAEKEKVKDYAPTILQTAKKALQQAEKELTENRYDTDVARNLARQAMYEAKHANYLANQFKKVKDKKMTMEELALMWEKPLHQISSSANMVAELDNGYQETTGKIVDYIQESQTNVQNLQQELNDRDEKIRNLEAENSQLLKELGGVSKEQMELKNRMAAQEKIRQKFQQVETMFNRTEAHVFREANDIYIRLVGLSFDVGKSTLNPENFSLLTKVQNAIKVFPASHVTIEGNTDSFGGDEANWRLSQERANAVRQYILANMNIMPEAISAVGYGETRPIANNETREGRAKNRRIDVKIRPHLE